MLYAQAQTEQGTKLRFFAGEGFEAAFYDGTPALVVFGADAPDEDTDELDDAAEAAAMEAEANAEVNAEAAAE